MTMGPSSNFPCTEYKRYIRITLRRSSRVIDVDPDQNGVLVTVETTELDKRPGERITVRVKNGEVIK